MSVSIIEKIRDQVSQVRMSLLGYKYDYDRETNEKIVSDVLASLRSKLEDSNHRKRRLARTMAQYRAQLITRPSLSVWLFEIASIVALPAFLAAMLALIFLTRDGATRAQASGVRLVFPKRWRTNPEIYSVPNELEAEKIATRALDGYRLTASDINLVLNLLWLSLQARTPFPAQLSLKCAVDLAHVRASLLRLHPRFIIVYWEFSCSLSFITQAMNDSQIETYNVMHGDKFYYAKHAFFEVTRCYCWNTFYVELFKEEWAEADFRVFQNESFVLTAEEKGVRAQRDTGSIGIPAPHIKTLTRLTSQESAAALSFTTAVNKLTGNHTVRLRPHPFYESEFEILKPHLSPKVVIENPKSTSPRDFLIANDIIIGTVSTLLLEAAHLGFDVIILSTEAMKSVESYHYLYRMENVRTCALDSLSQEVANIDASRAVRQTDNQHDGKA